MEVYNIIIRLKTLLEGFGGIEGRGEPSHAGYLVVVNTAPKQPEIQLAPPFKYIPEKPKPKVAPKKPVKRPAKRR